MNWESLNSSDKDKYKKIIAAQIEKEETEFKKLYPFPLKNEDILENQKLLDHFYFESEDLADFFSQMTSHESVVASEDKDSFPNVLWDNCTPDRLNKTLTAQTVFKGIGIPFSITCSETSDKVLVRVDFCTIKSEALVDKSTHSLDLHIRTCIWPKIASWAGRIKRE